MYFFFLGYVVFIGYKIGKCIVFLIRNKYCRKCDSVLKKGCDVKEYDCRKNWEGSFKVMELDMCIFMLKNLESNDVCVGMIIMDNDFIMIFKVCLEVIIRKFVK